MKPEVRAGYEEICGAFFQAILELRSVDETAPSEFNFFKTVVDGPCEEKYLIQIQHIEGPKFTKDNK